MTLFDIVDGASSVLFEVVSVHLTLGAEHLLLPSFRHLAHVAAHFFDFRRSFDFFLLFDKQVLFLRALDHTDVIGNL